MDELGQRVRYAIDRLHSSHRGVAVAIGMEPTKLSKSLSGARRFRVDELVAIADETQVSTDWILHGTGPTPESNQPPPRRRVPAGSGTRRIEILESAWRLVARRGLHQVRIADIAEACDTSSAAIHYYFPGKQDVMRSALLHCSEAAFTRQSRELEEIPDARDRLLRLIELLLPTPGQVRDEWMIWLQVSSVSALNPELRPVHNDFYRRWRTSVADVVRLGQEQEVFRDVDPDRAALVFMSLADGLALQVLTGAPGHSVESMREHLLDLSTQLILLPEESPSAVG